MASRLTPPALPHIDLPNPGRLLRTSAISLVRSWPRDRGEWRLALWRACFFPWWFWSDLPRPRLPEKNVPLPPGGLAGEYVKSRFASIARRTWLQRVLIILIRTVWLTILIAVVWQAVELAGGPPVQFTMIPMAGALLLVPALILMAFSRPTNAQIARMLDRSFHLQERMVTSLTNLGRELPAPGERATLPYLQVADAANALTAIRSNPAFRVTPPFREIMLVLFWSLVLTSLFFLRGGGGEIPPLQSALVPEFIPAAQRYVTGPQTDLPAGPLSEGMQSDAQMQQLAEETRNIRQDLLTLAEALEDHALTRSAANALEEGDYARAVQELRSTAEQADALTQSERSSMADDLDSASSAMSDSSSGLSTASGDAANGLREGGTEAEQGMQGLADAVEESASRLAANEAPGESGDPAQSSQSTTSETAPGQSPRSSEQESLFDDWSGGGNAGEGDSSEEAANESSEDPSGNSQEENSGERSNEQGDQNSGEGDQGQGNADSEQQAPSEDSGPGGETPGDNPAMMDQSQVADAGQGSSTGDGQATDGPESEESNPSDLSSSDGDQQDPAEPDVSDAAGATGSGSDDETTPGGTVVLNRSPQGEAVPIQGTGSQSYLGSGSDVASGSGSSTQGTISSAGPDSNHVPREYRGIVEAYFSPGDE